MASKVTNEVIAAVEMKFVDGDTRTLNLKNPRADITTNDITDLNSYIQANNLLIGDKDGGTFGRITTVTKKYTRTEYLDIDNPS